LFLSYRNSWDGGRFYEWDYGGLSETYELISKSESLSLGIRLHTNTVKKTRDIDDDNHSSIGLKAGGNFSTMVYANPPVGEESNNGVQTGAHLGMYFKIRLGKRFALTPELVYIHKQENFNSVEIPVMLSYIFTKQISIEGGLQLGLLPSQKIRTINVYEESISKGADLGWNAGLKRQISKKFAVGCRYYQSLKNITSWYESGVPVATSGSNRNLQLSGYCSFGKR